MDAALNPRRLLLEMLEASERRGHDVVARVLRDLGITHVFGVGGVPIDATLGACARLGLRVIGARHQQGAVLMSLAFNYVSGGLHSAVLVSAGPAVTNCATGLLVGKENCWPLLVIAGRRGLAVPGAFQAFDGAAFVSPVAKWTALVADTAELSHVLTQAAVTAISGAPGPVYIDVAEEALGGCAQAQVSASAVRPAAQNGARALDAAGVEQAAALIADARRPVMLIGKGARWSEATALLRRLANDYGVAFASSPMGCGLLPDDHPLCFSALRARLLAEADLVLVIGARLNWTFRFGNEISRHARIVRIDIDPVEAANVLGRGIGVQGDAAVVLESLLGVLDAHRRSTIERDAGWLARMKACRDALGIGAVPPAEHGLVPMSPYEWLGELAGALPQDAITVLDGNTVMAAAQRMLPVRRPASRLGPGTNGCMGVGIPFAIGGKLARPERPVIAIVGDFGFGLSAFELETAVRHCVPVVIVVANNAGAGGATRQGQFFPAAHPERVSRYGTDVRHDLTMRSCGGRGYRVEFPGELRSALADAFASGSPACIDVMTNEHTAVGAAI
jgi:2-hydroxyacyl-CoA lyase 1